MFIYIMNIWLKDMVSTIGANMSGKIGGLHNGSTWVLIIREKAIFISMQYIIYLHGRQVIKCITNNQ